MKIALGIPTYNRTAILLKTIDCALRQQPAADEIIVVDQSDMHQYGRDRLVELAERGVIRYYRQEIPNLPMARNRILRESTCDIVIFIDDDVVLSPGFIEAHRAHYRDSDVCGVCGAITERGIRVRPERPRIWPKYLDYKYFDSGWNIYVNDFGTFKGGNHSLRRNMALTLGGYDEAFTGVALREETDMAFRLMRAGCRIVFDPSARLHHLRAPSGGCRISEWGDWSAGVAVMRFAIKHRDLLRYHYWLELWRACRLSVLNRNNIKHPLRLIKRTHKIFRLYIKMLNASSSGNF